MNTDLMLFRNSDAAMSETLYMLLVIVGIFLLKITCIFVGRFYLISRDRRFGKNLVIFRLPAGRSHRYVLT